MSVEVKSLIKTYGNQNAVDNISFNVTEGEIVGFLGPNGAGKSTTMKIATCYLPPTSGTVLVYGLDVNEESGEVKRITGYLPEHNPLYLDMYLHEYLRFIGGLHHMKGAKLDARIDEMIELTGLTREQHKKLGALSKGYRQRVGLAQAMIHDPKVLVLDEPTSGLDPNQIVEIRSLIKDIGKKKTVILSTHIMQEVKAICDRVVIINLGKIVADSKIADLPNKNQAGDAILHVEFESAPGVDFFKSINGVKSVSPISEIIYQLVIDSQADVRGQIFRKAADSKKVLVGLKQEETSLEQVFQQLTKTNSKS